VRFVSCLVGLVLLFVACVGCDMSPRLYPVTGTVTYQNGPVEGANVQFVPTQGISATGVTDASGKFSLMTAGKPGAAAGDYKVTVSKVSSGGTSTAATPDDMKKMQAGGNMERKSALPEVYGSIHTTTLTATVKSGDNDIPLVLK
jgi:hypothetical protein